MVSIILKDYIIINIRKSKKKSKKKSEKVNI